MIEIFLDRGAYEAGESINAEIRLTLKKTVKARGIFAALKCVERKKVKRTRVLDSYDYARDAELGVPRSTNVRTTETEQERVWFLQEKRVAGEGEYKEGTFQVGFSLPKNAPPTSHEFGHDNLVHVWRLRVKLDVPMALDENAEKEVKVLGL
ncbi:hypothetical protein COV61_01050 [Candidatus Micrarchaeota archaeon CG11_big_fil_rev_8_21_14_0_20_47_5]|nr:MAG: hypothetical protein AUJ17_04130 [Candidatus Micrarchaeota archaeon CG1_02_47_40]PIN84140.1 MAG: hypothetical protein COV61_01050 [Candidatus Micrarchaeota archaeon CG11_big_fil_rev_8_21_14_0_20_47_5]QBM01424.1 hypothetical protein [uncultured archaeon]